MAEVGTAFVSILPSAKGFGSKLDSQVGGEVDKTGKKVGSKFGTALKVGAAAALGGAAIATGFLKGAIAEARESQKVGALTASVIKATGGAAGVTAKQVGDLAGALSAKTGIDDEVIQSGQNMLLTFKNIRNEAGKGNDIFNQTSKTLVDMAAAMGTEPKQAAIQLGKALNDPIKGVSALSRVGVTFTEGQKKQIKALVESGKTMAAQKIVLRELNSEFGGAAAAQATAGDKMRVAFGNLQEQVGTALLPTVDRLANIITNTVIPAVSQFVAEIQTGTGLGGQFATVFRAVATVLGSVFGFIANNKAAVATFVGTLVTVVAVTKVWAAAQAAMNIVLAANPIGLVVVALGALVAGLIYAYKHSQTFRNIVNAAFAAVRSVVGAVVGWLAKYVPGVFSAVVGAVKAYMGVYKAVIVTAFNVVRGAISAVSKAWSAGVAAVAKFASGVGNAIGKAVGFVKELPGKILSAVAGFGSLLFNAGASLISGLISGITSKLGELGSKLGGVGSFIKEHKGPPEYDKVMLTPAGRSIMDGLIVGIESKRPDLRSKLGAVTGDIGLGRAALAAGTSAGLAARGGHPGSVILRVGDHDMQAWFEENFDGEMALR